MKVSGKYKPILIAITVAIWAFVIMRYFNIGFFSKDKDINSIVNARPTRITEDLEVRSFKMGKITRDPFHVKSPSKILPAKSNRSRENSFVQEKFIEKTTIRNEKKDSLNIMYHGLIKSENGSTKIFFTFNQSSKIMTIGDTQNKFILKSANADSAVLFNTATKENVIFKTGVKL